MVYSCTGGAIAVIIEQNINSIIKQEYDELKHDYEIFGIFLYGSQNYNLATPESDIDTKMIVIPSFDDLVMKKPISKTVKFPWGECDIKDVREMVKSYKKQNVNFIETLFTDFYYINPAYQTMYDKLVIKREEIAHYDEHKALDCFNGLMMRSKKKLTTPTDKTKEDIEKYGYHPKSLMNICKFAAMTKKYINGADYKTVLKSDRYIFLRNGTYETEKALFFAEKLDEQTKNRIQNAEPKPVNEKTGRWLDAWTKTIIGINISLYDPL